jgi:hypothetical protein
VITVSYEIARERAARGAALLDERSPNWWRQLYPEGIVMVYETTCVLGSLNPDVGYQGMLDELNLIDTGVNESNTAVWYGFDVADDEVGDGSFESYSRLTDAWRCLIANRQVKAGLR